MNLIDRLETFGIVLSACGSCRLEQVGAWYELRGHVGAVHCLAVSVTSLERLAAHWEGFVHNCTGKTTYCPNWDSFDPQPVYDRVTSQCIGMLQPRMTQAQIAATPGIQGWSAPTHETRTR